jgi:ubiquinone/menaquinone biosynthesis C-methylase UbiE
MSASQSPASVESYWDTVAENFDRNVTDGLTRRARRRILWRHLDHAFAPGQRILELNCGTGVDAAHLAERNIRILACDVSPGMIEAARTRMTARGVHDLLQLRVLPTERLGELSADGPFDGALSCFAGLNCVQDLPQVARDLSLLLRPGATAVICMMGKLVLWEILWYLAHGNPQKAVQRMRKTEIETDAVKVRYYSRREIREAFAPYFILKQWKGLGITVPPSYMESWARRFSRTTAALSRADLVLSGVPLVRNLADSVLLHFERKPFRSQVTASLRTPLHLRPEYY